MKRTMHAQNGKIMFINDDPSNKAIPDLPVSEYLAKMIEYTVFVTNLSITINSTSGGSHAPRSFHQFGMAVGINRINDKRIDDPDNAGNVRLFQEKISLHPDVAECFGPFVNIRKKGTKVTHKSEMKEKHLNHLHISSQR